MCKLIPLKLQDGRSINVAEPKYEHVKKYLDVLPMFKSFQRVILFGDALSSECTENSEVRMCYIYDKLMNFAEDMAEMNFEIFPEAVDDDWLALTEQEFSMEPFRGSDISNMKKQGVILYDRENTCKKISNFSGDRSCGHSM